jgi:hypothetical protein
MEQPVAELDTLSSDARTDAAWQGHETGEFAGVGVHQAPKLLNAAPDSVLAELEGMS